MRILCFQHAAFEDIGGIEKWAVVRRRPIQTIRLYDGEAVPSNAKFDILIILGGPMSVHDEDKYPWLREEKAVLRQAITDGKKVIGICLGAQLVAEALGARVYPNKEKEIGWHPVTRTANAADGIPIADALPEKFETFHWHGETFDIPKGATHLAKSEATPNQAFIWRDHVLAMQFHFEITQAGAKGLIEHCRDELVPGKHISTEKQILASPGDFALGHALILQLLDRFVKWN